MNNSTKAILTAAMAGFMAYSKELLVPIILAAVVMGLDYISGVAAAWVRGNLSSRIGIFGIVKKVAYALVIAVAIVVDWIVRVAAAKVGIEAGSFYVFGLLVTVWIIINECISILENVDKMGVKVPPFLKKMIEKLKSSAENRGDSAGGGEGYDGG